jgi:thiol-disulfide isomerase/thioredoxin
MQVRRFLRIAIGMIGLAALQGLLVLVYLNVEEGRRAPAETGFGYERLPSRPAPELILASLDGRNRRLSDLRGRPILLHFWATWCPPCREELPGLLELGRELSAAGELELLAVSLDTDWTAIRAFFGGVVPAEVVLERSGVSQRSYDLSTLPDTYLLSADGVLQARFGGARNWRTQAALDTVLRTARGVRVEQ